MTFENFADFVGKTPLVRYRVDAYAGGRVFIKVEGQNPTGSVKDRAGIRNIRGALDDGTLVPGKTILDASSGNMACSLAYFGAVLGYPVEVVCSSKLTEDKASFIRYFGAKLSRIGDLTIEANRHCRNLIMADEPERFAFLDQLHNWSNPAAHFETTGPEILHDLPDVAAVVGSLGSGGTMNGVTRYVRQASPATKMVAVESASGTKLPGTGAFVDGEYVTPFIKQLRDDRLLDDTVRVSMEEAIARNTDLKRQGFFCGLQTAAVVDAAVRYATANDLHGDVAVISGDSGWKNMDKLMALC